MPATMSAYDIEIDAPDGAAAVELENRLWSLTPTTVGRGTDWIVEIPGPASADEIEAVVRDWLDDLGQRSTTMRVGGHMLRVEGHRAHRPMHTASHIDFIG
jgi:hypothetical protein